MKRVLLTGIFYLVFFSCNYAQIPPEETKKNEKNIMLPPAPPPEPLYSSYNRRVVIEGVSYIRKRIFLDYYTIRKKEKGSYTSKIGLLWKDEILLPCLYRNETIYNNGSKEIIILSKDNKMGAYHLIEKEWILKPEYMRVESYPNNVFVLKKSNYDKLIVVDEENTILFNKEFISLKNLNSSHLIFSIRSNNLYTDFDHGLIDLKSKEVVIPALYKKMHLFDEKKEILEVMDENRLYNLINIKGERLFKNWYEMITVPYWYSSKNLIVKHKNRVGVLDYNEKKILPFRFSSIDTAPLKNRIHLARKINGKYGLLKLNGEIVLPFKYDHLVEKTALHERNGKEIILLAVRKNKKYYVRIKDNITIERIYE